MNTFLEIHNEDSALLRGLFLGYQGVGEKLHDRISVRGMEEQYQAIGLGEGSKRAVTCKSSSRHLDRWIF